MRRLFISQFRYCSIVIILTGVLINAANVKIDTDANQRRFDGWGTSLCWWGQMIGDYSEKSRDSIISLVFDSVNGLGLNIIRYNIGGGDAPSHNHMGIGKEMVGFLDGSDKPYDWTRDSGQRWVLEAGKKRIAPDKFIAEAFSNSPPYWMTVSGCASGASNSGENLKSTMYPQFADYLTEVVRQFAEAWGISFVTLEPLNEPMGDWWNVNGGQEGCSFSRVNQSKLIREVYTKLKVKKLATRIAASDEAGYDEAVATYTSFDSSTRACIHQINTHGYSGSKRSELRKLADRDGKKLWASEIDGSGAPAPFDMWKHDHGDIAPALDIANRIIRDLRELQPDAWILWQVVESEQAQISLDKNWGCIHADYNGGEKFTICPKFHAVRQFTKFIRPGSIMIGCDNSEAVAFFTSDRSSIVIVQRNNTQSDVTTNFQFEDTIRLQQNAAVWRTSVDEQCKELDEISVKGNTLTAIVKALSITTFIVQLSGSTTTRTPQRIRNRDIHLEPVCTGGRFFAIVNHTECTIPIELYHLDGRCICKKAIVPGINPIDKQGLLAGGVLLIRAEGMCTKLAF